MIEEIEISKELLQWRIGDEITAEHRTAVASWLAVQGNYSDMVASATLKTCLSEPDNEFADLLAPFVAVVSDMDLKAFVRYFPQIANESDGLAVEMFMRMKFPKQGEPL